MGKEEKKMSGFQFDVQTIARKVRSNRMSRREAIKLFGSAGVAAAGALALGRGVARAHQEGTPESTGPVLGPQADGSNLWGVKIGDMRMEILQEIHAFFPQELTVTVGDSVLFQFGMPGFHTVTFFSGEPVPPLQIPDPEQATPVAGAPTMIFNPLLLQSSDGGDYDGTGYLNSGPDFFRDPSKPFIVRFTKAGSYDYVCWPHAPGMAAKVTVVEPGTALPKDQATYDAETEAQVAALYDKAAAEAEALSTPGQTTQADGTTLWEATVGAGEGPERIQQFLPATLEIKVGDTVKWVRRSPGEPHTATLLGAGESAPEDLIPSAFADGTPKFVQNSETQLPSGGNVFSGTGFVNSGWLMPEFGLPNEWSCTFDTAGEFVVYCILHGDAAGNGMAGKVIVS
jgi:plastocyanin